MMFILIIYKFFPIFYQKNKYLVFLFKIKHFYLLFIINSKLKRRKILKKV